MKQHIMQMLVVFVFGDLEILESAALLGLESEAPQRVVKNTKLGFLFLRVAIFPYNNLSKCHLGEVFGVRLWVRTKEKRNSFYNIFLKYLSSHA